MSDIENNLNQLALYPKRNRDKICEVLSGFIDKAIKAVNEEFIKRKLSKLSNDIEPLPQEPKQLSSYRARLGTILEYAVGTQIDSIFEIIYGDALTLTFTYAHKYPDFNVRNTQKKPILKIESKAVNCQSDEQAARFDAPTSKIDENRDFVLFMAWEWNEEDEGPYKWMHPYIFDYILIPSYEIAKERDKRLELLGGKIEGDTVLVFSKSKEQMVKDPGNYGKFWRIVHPSRRNSEDLNEYIVQFLNFQKEIDQKAPPYRLRKFNPVKQTRKLNQFGHTV